MWINAFLCALAGKDDNKRTLDAMFVKGENERERMKSQNTRKFFLPETYFKRTTKSL